MALQDIDVASLRGAINACLNSLDNSYSTEIASSLASDSVWSGQAKSNLKQALETLSTTRYDELKEKLNAYLLVADSIEEYQTLYSEIKDLESKLSNKRTSLYYMNNNSSSVTNTETKLRNEINSIESEISEKNISLESLESSIVIE
jgi:chromosome segregation ATPase